MNNMTTVKKLLIAGLAAAPLWGAAQGRIATVNVKAIYDLMPEKLDAEARLKATSEQYQKEYKAVQEEFNQKYAIYQALDDSTPATIKERRMQEIKENDQKIQQFLNQAESDLKEREQALNKPILDKINAAIRAVGNEGGYTYIIDASQSSIVYTGSDAIDVTGAVKAKLGL